MCHAFDNQKRAIIFVKIKVNIVAVRRGRAPFPAAVTLMLVVARIADGVRFPYAAVSPAI